MVTSYRIILIFLLLTGSAFADARLRFVTPPQPDRLSLVSDTDLSVVLTEADYAVRLTTMDGALVTVPAELSSLATVRAVLLESGEAATILRFDTPIQIATVTRADHLQQYDFSGTFRPQVSWPLINWANISNPHATTVLGNAFRVIGFIVDVSAGASFAGSRVSDDALIQGLSAEVVALRSELQRLRGDQQVKMQDRMHGRILQDQIPKGAGK